MTIEFCVTLSKAVALHFILFEILYRGSLHSKPAAGKGINKIGASSGVTYRDNFYVLGSLLHIT